MYPRQRPRAKKGHMSVFSWIRHDKKDKGFTLPEILITLVIVGILSAIAIPVALNQRTKGVESSVSADVVATASQLDAVVQAWRGVPPAKVTVTTDTSSKTWTALPQDMSAVASGKVNEGTDVKGTVWTDGSYCVWAKTSYISDKVFFYRSDYKTVTPKSGQSDPCPTAAFGGVGTVNGSAQPDLPDAPSTLTLDCTQDNAIAVEFSKVSGATSYVVTVVGVESKEVTQSGNATLNSSFTSIQPGVATVIVYAKNANGSGPGINKTCNVQGTAKYALNSRVGTYTYKVANQTEKNALAGMVYGSTAYVVADKWTEMYVPDPDYPNDTTKGIWVITSGNVPYATVYRTTNLGVGTGATTFTGTSTTTGGMSYSNGEVTIPRTGRYTVSFTAVLSTGAAGARYGLIKVGTTTVATYAGFSNGSQQVSLVGARTITLNAGEKVSLSIDPQGLSLNVIGSLVPYFDVSYVGPADPCNRASITC